MQIVYFIPYTHFTLFFILTLYIIPCTHLRLPFYLYFYQKKSPKYNSESFIYKFQLSCKMTKNSRVTFSLFMVSLFSFNLLIYYLTFSTIIPSMHLISSLGFCIFSTFFLEDDDQKTCIRIKFQRTRIWFVTLESTIT